jgi:hypothetical protein
MRDILFRFKDRVFSYIEPMDVDIPLNASDSHLNDLACNHFIEFFYKRPFFTGRHQHVISLINSFCNWYPNLGRELEKTRSELPNLVAKEINHLRYLEEARKVQKICKHKYERPFSIHKLLYDPNRLYDQRDVYEHCRRCHHTRFKERIKI